MSFISDCDCHKLAIETKLLPTCIEFSRDERHKHSSRKIKERIAKKIAEFRKLSKEHAEYSIKKYNRTAPYYFTFKEHRGAATSMTIKLDNAETGERFIARIKADHLPAQCIARDIDFEAYIKQLRCAEVKARVEILIDDGGRPWVWFDYDKIDPSIHEMDWEYPIA